MHDSYNSNAATVAIYVALAAVETLGSKSSEYYYLQYKKNTGSLLTILYTNNLPGVTVHLHSF